MCSMKARFFIDFFSGPRCRHRRRSIRPLPLTALVFFLFTLSPPVGDNNRCFLLPSRKKNATLLQIQKIKGAFLCFLSIGFVVLAKGRSENEVDFFHLGRGLYQNGTFSVCCVLFVVGVCM